MKFPTTFVLAGLLAGALTIPGLTSTAQAHDKGNENGKSKHNFCYDKHGRWRSHPHCPSPQPSYARRHYGDREHYHGHSHPHYYYARDRYQHRPPVIYVRKDVPYDYRSRYARPRLRDSRTTVGDARREVQLGRNQLRNERAELKKDRAELRRDVRNRASKEKIRADRREIRADLQTIKNTRQEIRNDRRELARRKFSSPFTRDRLCYGDHGRNSSRSASSNLK